MKVELVVPESVAEPRIWVRHQPVLIMALRTGSIELGPRRSEMMRLTYGAGEMCLFPRHFATWARTDDLPYMTVCVSDVALAAACDGARGGVEFRRVESLVDARVAALAAAVNEERVAGFPSGRLFLDSIEQALAVALVNGYALHGRSVQTYRGGLGSSRLRIIKDFVDAEMEADLSLDEMAQSVKLSTSHFSRMFRKSTGETPHQFLLRQRVERAKQMLRSADVRVIDVAAACGFKTQQHFAQVFRQMCGASPTEYRENFLGNDATCSLEIDSRNTPRRKR